MISNTTKTSGRNHILVSVVEFEHISYQHVNYCYSYIMKRYLTNKGQQILRKSELWHSITFKNSIKDKFFFFSMSFLGEWLNYVMTACYNTRQRIIQALFGQAWRISLDRFGVLRDNYTQIM